jgi:class 3 adenylate cyclase
MKKFQDTFQDVFQQTYNNIKINDQNVLTYDFAALSKSVVVEARGSQVAIPSTHIQQQYNLQNYIRPIFGKLGVNKSSIGTHPDFIGLEGNNNQAVKHYICTIFIDLKGSTRLALIYDLEDVFRLKNAFIQTCIDTVRAFDGHVHRLMGDAVMGFFGGNSMRPEDAIIDAINCATTLHLLFKSAIIPWMDKQGYDSTDIGFRIGLDFGDDDDVFWAFYGYDSVSEVTATGLQVDMASKLQGHARKNQAMLGQTLLDFIDWPEEYSSKKTEKNGSMIREINYVEPNITNRYGASLNYKMRMLNFDNLLRLSPLASKFKYEPIFSIGNILNSYIQYGCYVIHDDRAEEYISMSRFLQKNLSLKFTISIRTHGIRYNYPLKVQFTKTNHGKEAESFKGAGEFQPQVKWVGQNNARCNNPMISTTKIDLDEATQYRGLHTMKAEVIDADGKVIFRDWIGVLIV